MKDKSEEERKKYCPCEAGMLKEMDNKPNKQTLQQAKSSKNYGKREREKLRGESGLMGCSIKQHGHWRPQ